MATKRRATQPRSAGEATPPATLLDTLRERFGAHPHRHPALSWDRVAARLDTRALAALTKMEASGGEPDVVTLEAGALHFVDCAAQSPSGRRSLCFDQAAWQARKEARPAGNVLDTAAAMGVALLSEDEYRALQSLEPFDTTTSSWVATPAAIREAGGALFCDRRYDHVFVYHNGAQSYYAARGFRAKLRID